MLNSLEGGRPCTSSAALKAGGGLRVRSFRGVFVKGAETTLLLRIDGSIRDLKMNVNFVRILTSTTLFSMSIAHKMTEDTSSTDKNDYEDASLVAEQEAFLSSGSLPAAKVIRTIEKPQNQHTGDEYVRHGPEWYQQMRGVRFRLDDLEEDDIPPKHEERAPRKSADTSPLGSAMMGDIVERKTSNAPPVFSASGQKNPKGFPTPRRLGRQAANQKVPIESSSPSGNQPEGKALMEEIDRENRKKMAEMSEEEILQLQKSLQESLPASLREKLLNKANTEKEPSTDVPTSSSKPVGKTPPNPSVSHIDDTFDDQSFDEHLRTFFPPSTTSNSRPEWTLPVHPAEEAFYSTPDNSSPEASTMRFDFNGKYIPPGTSRILPTHLGLHHHSLDPGAAGYTFSELSILARSIQPSQKCIALKIIGCVLTDIAKGKYTWDITEGLWDEIDREKIVEILLEVAKGGKEFGGNRSVQRYAEDAVSKWVDADGPTMWEERLRKKGFEKVDTE